MKEKLRITIIQSNIEWEKSEVNRNWYQEKIESIQEETDLIVLPEMFTTAFSMNSKKLAEVAYGDSFQWMKELASKKNAVLTGSVIIEESNSFYNRLIWMRPDGTFGKYDKRHLFRMANENQFFSQGLERAVFELFGWRINTIICYDLRFPVWIRNQNDYDVLVCVANWPKVRADVWKSLLKARALENQVYVVGVNRIGIDGNGKEYSGDSMVLDAKGNQISKTKAMQDSVETVEILYTELVDFRKAFPVDMDRDDFKIL